MFTLLFNSIKIIIAICEISTYIVLWGNIMAQQGCNNLKYGTCVCKHRFPPILCKYITLQASFYFIKQWMWNPETSICQWCCSHPPTHTLLHMTQVQHSTDCEVSTLMFSFNQKTSPYRFVFHLTILLCSQRALFPFGEAEQKHSTTCTALCNRQYLV